MVEHEPNTQLVSYTRKCMGHLNENGANGKYRGNGYYVTNDATVGQRSFCLHTFHIFHEDKMSFSENACNFKFH